MKKLFFAVLFLFSGIAFAQQQNIAGTVLPLAARTSTTVNSQDMVNSNWRGGHIIITTTAFTSGTYTPHIQGITASGVYYDLLVGTGTNIVSGVGTIVMKVYPYIGAIAGGAANDIVPLGWRVQMIGASTPSMTFKVEYNFDD